MTKFWLWGPDHLDGNLILDVQIFWTKFWFRRNFASGLRPDHLGKVASGQRPDPLKFAYGKRPNSETLHLGNSPDSVIYASRKRVQIL